MTTARQLEILLDSAITSGLCPELRGCVPATGEVLPAQYLLLTRDLPRVRAVLRQVAKALLVLLDVADAAYADGDPNGCAKFHALAAAPDWLLRPSDPEDIDLDVALVWECTVDHGGDWHRLLESLHQASSTEWQWAIRRCRAMMRFEKETGKRLAEIIAAPSAIGTEPTVDEDVGTPPNRRAGAPASH
ncbi:hypothetical protein GF348_08045 [candidate division KSB3 bacterium]|nr:hypothetical protein [candidate division KSB3 bacterium]